MALNFQFKIFVKRTVKDYLVISMKGIAMGAADVVPGVSGGTIAFISGIYEELIDSINQVNLGALKILKKEGFGAMWVSVNGNFLLALLLGIGISVLSLARLIRHFLETQPILIWSFFFGLVLASIIYVAMKIQRWNLGKMLLLILGALIGFGITTLTPQTAEVTYLYVFLSGALAICAMILPGISGGYILLLLGMYKPVLDALHDKNIGLLVMLMAGAVIGLLSFSRLLKWLFDHYESLTLALLTGFIIGSLNKIWPWKEVLSSEIINGKLKILDDKSVMPFSYGGDPQLGTALFLGLTGFVFIVLLEKLAMKKNS